MGYYSDCRKIVLSCDFHNSSENDYNKFLAINDKVLADIIVKNDGEGEYLIRNYSSLFYNSHYKLLDKYSIDEKVLLKIFNSLKNFKSNYFNLNTDFIKSLKGIAFDKFSINLFDSNDLNESTINWYFNNTKWADRFDYKVLLTAYGRYLIDTMIENNIPYSVDSRFLENSEWEIQRLDKTDKEINIIREYTEKIINYCQYKHYRGTHMYSYKENVEKQINDLKDNMLKQLLSLELKIADADITENMKKELKDTLMKHYKKAPDNYIHWEQVFIDYQKNL